MELISTFVKEKNGKAKHYETIKAFNKMFIVELDKNGNAKIKKDIEVVEKILAKGINNITLADRFTLLNIYNVSYHESGKIEGVFSFDSSATNCGFCQAMRELAKLNPGTVICEFCYDYDQEKYRYAALNRHTLNMIIMSTIEFSVDELATLPAGYRIRVNSSGDATNEIYARNMLKLGYAFLNSKVAIWTKNSGVYIAACRAIGKPQNVKLIKSSIYIDKPEELPEFFDYVFTVYFDKEKVAAALANGGSECNGKKCRDCGYKCYDGLWDDGDNIIELLRK